MNTVLIILTFIGLIIIICTNLDDVADSPGTNGKNVMPYWGYTGSHGYQPYEKLYGKNREQGPCAVMVTASPIVDVVVIVRNNNIDGDVAGHLFIEKGTTGTICLPEGRYQVFFYSGYGWNPQKEMDCGLMGGFTSDELFQEDPFPRTYSTGMRREYALRLVTNGNFAPVSTDKDLFF